MQQSIDISHPPGPQQQTSRCGYCAMAHAGTDGRALYRYIDPAPHTRPMREVPINAVDSWSNPQKLARTKIIRLTVTERRRRIHGSGVLAAFLECRWRLASGRVHSAKHKATIWCLSIRPVFSNINAAMTKYCDANSLRFGPSARGQVHNV